MSEAGGIIIGVLEKGLATMKIAMIGLGKMGANMAQRLGTGGHLLALGGKCLVSDAMVVFDQV